MPVICRFHLRDRHLTIFSTQVRDFLGLRITGTCPGGVYRQGRKFWHKYIGTTDRAPASPSESVSALIKLWPPRWGRYIPGTIVAVIAGTAIVSACRIPVETLGSRFGVEAIPRTLPAPHWPRIDWGHLSGLVRPAFTIALLASIESLLCAVVSDGMIEDRHDSNTELCALGVANIGSALFGGLPATGALARTAANIRSGARSPIAGITHSATLLAVVFLAAPLARFIPLPVLSAVLVVGTLNMGEWHHLARGAAHWPTSDAVVYLLTFLSLRSLPTSPWRLKSAWYSPRCSSSAGSRKRRN